MSVEAAAQFLKSISEEEALKEQLETASKEEVIKLAQSKGYEMTMEEFKQVLNVGKTRYENSGEELSDDDLEQVAGGFAVMTAFAVAGAAYSVYDLGNRRGWW